MKKILLLIVSAAAIACSSDSDNSPATLKLPTSYTFNAGWHPTVVYTFTYDAENRVEKIVGQWQGIDITDVYTFTYDDNNRVLSINRTGNNPHLNEFTYDDQGRESSWSYDSNEPQPIYVLDDIYYHDQLHMTYSYNSFGDLATRSYFYEHYTFTYESGKFGAFKNVVGNSQTVGIFLEGTLLQAVCRQPLTGVLTAPNNTSTSVNTYDGEGYITGFTTTSGNGLESSGVIRYNQ